MRKNLPLTTPCHMEWYQPGVIRAESRTAAGWAAQGGVCAGRGVGLGRSLGCGAHLRLLRDEELARRLDEAHLVVRVHEGEDGDVGEVGRRQAEGGAAEDALDEQQLAGQLDVDDMIVKTS